MFIITSHIPFKSLWLRESCLIMIRWCNWEEGVELYKLTSSLCRDFTFLLTLQSMTNWNPPRGRCTSVKPFLLSLGKNKLLTIWVFSLLPWDTKVRPYLFSLIYLIDCHCVAMWHAQTLLRAQISAKSLFGIICLCVSEIWWIVCWRVGEVLWDWAKTNVFLSWQFTG